MIVFVYMTLSLVDIAVIYTLMRVLFSPTPVDMHPGEISVKEIMLFGGYYIVLFAAFFYGSSSIVNGTLALILLAGLTRFYTQSWSERAFVSVVVFLIVYAAGALPGLLFMPDVIFPTLIYENHFAAFYPPVLVFGKLIILFVTLLILEIKKENVELVEKNLSLNFVVGLTIVTHVFILATLVGYESLQGVFYYLRMLLAGFVFGSLLLMLLLLYNLESLYESHWQKKIFAHERASYRRQLALVYENEKTSKSLQHDMIKHIQVLNAFCMKEDYASLQEYISQYHDALQEFHPEVYTNHVVIDSFINDLVHQAEMHAVCLQKTIRISDPILVNDYDLSIILSNIFENAMNAVVALPRESRWIKLVIFSKEGMLKLALKKSNIR